MKKRINFLILIIIGTISISTGCFAYLQTQFTPSAEPFPSDNSGLGFFVSEDVNLTRTGYDNPHIMIWKLNHTQRSASVEVTIYIELSSGHNQHFLYFGFQTPYNVSDVNVKVKKDWLEPELLTPRYAKDGRLIYFKIEKSSTSSYSFDLVFRWQPFLYRTGYSEYKALIPFALYLDTDEVLKEIGNDVSLNDITVKDLTYSVLSITLPIASTPQIVVPEPDYHGLASQALWFYWRIDKLWKSDLPSPPSLPSIFLGFEIRALEETRGYYAFWSGLAFGVGIPVLVQAIISINNRFGERLKQIKNMVSAKLFQRLGS